MFKVRVKKTGKIIKAYGSQRDVNGFTQFLVYKNNTWVWESCEKFEPVKILKSDSFGGDITKEENEFYKNKLIKEFDVKNVNTLERISYRSNCNYKELYSLVSKLDKKLAKEGVK